METPIPTISISNAAIAAVPATPTGEVIIAATEAGPFGGLMGGAASLYTAFSDRRLKTNLKIVGVDQRTSLNLYEFNYKSDPTRRFVGVMADEVDLMYPEAVITSEDGFLMVDYDALGIEMKEVSNG